MISMSQYNHQYFHLESNRSCLHPNCSGDPASFLHLFVDFLVFALWVSIVASWRFITKPHVTNDKKLESDLVAQLMPAIATLRCETRQFIAVFLMSWIWETPGLLNFFITEPQFLLFQNVDAVLLVKVLSLFVDVAHFPVQQPNSAVRDSSYIFRVCFVS